MIVSMKKRGVLVVSLVLLCTIVWVMIPKNQTPHQVGEPVDIYQIRYDQTDEQQSTHSSTHRHHPNNNNNNNEIIVVNGDDIQVPKDASNSIDPKLFEIDWETLPQHLDDFNKDRPVKNSDKFQLAPDHVPLVVRVYDRHEYLQFLVDNLRHTIGISETILIVSHDSLCKEVFKVVDSIDFMQVKQIIHPYSKNIIDSETLVGQNPVTRPKHHFWWMLNYIWDVFLIGFNGDIVVLEEDHVQTWDFYITSKKIAKIRNEICPLCWNSKLIQHGKPTEDGAEGLFLSIDQGNVGMIFDRPRWEIFKKAGKEFCSFDDYNVDWTMTHLAGIGLLERKSLTVGKPRSFDVGKCGLHAHSDSCEIPEHSRQAFDNYNKQILEELGTDVENWWRDYTFSLTPWGHKNWAHRGWGGWNSKADIDHCISQMRN